MVNRLLLAALVGALALPYDDAAGQALPTGAPVAGTTTDEAPATYSFRASSAGVLTVVASSAADIALLVADEDGQQLQGGMADLDYMGSTGLEFVSVVIPEAGVYRVQVRVWDSSDGPVAFEIAGSFIGSSAFGGTPDPDRRPSRANPIGVGEARSDMLNSSEGDGWDWFVVEASSAGTLVIVTRMTGESDGDLALEAYLGDDYTSATVRSDQDLQGALGNESITVDVKAGDLLRIKVEQLGYSSGPVPYRISVGAVP